LTEASIFINSFTPLLQSILIRWEPPPLEDRNGPITGYKIKYRKVKKTGVPKTETTPGNVRFFELKNLDRMSAYQIKIAAMTVNGTGPLSEWNNIDTYENDLDETQVPGEPGWIKSELFVCMHVDNLILTSCFPFQHVLRLIALPSFGALQHNKTSR